MSSSSSSTAAASAPFQLPAGVTVSDKNEIQDARYAYQRHGYLGNASTSTLQSALNADLAAKDAAAKEQEPVEVSAWKKPFIAVGNFITLVFSKIADGFKALINFFSFSSSKEVEADAPANDVPAVAE